MAKNLFVKSMKQIDGTPLDSTKLNVWIFILAVALKNSKNVNKKNKKKGLTNKPFCVIIKVQ